MFLIAKIDTRNYLVKMGLDGRIQGTCKPFFKLFLARLVGVLARHRKNESFLEGYCAFFEKISVYLSCCEVGEAVLKLIGTMPKKTLRTQNHVAQGAN